jgi:hypothetical protein
MSETARDGGQSAAGCQAPCVIVAVFREQARSCTNLALCLLCDAPRHGGFARHLPFRPHIAHYLGAIGGLAGLFRRWRWCGRRWRWRTGAAAENDCAERQGCKNAFPKTFHRLTRDKGCTHLCDNRTPPESSRGVAEISLLYFFIAHSAVLAWLTWQFLHYRVRALQAVALQFVAQFFEQCRHRFG